MAISWKKCTHMQKWYFSCYFTNTMKNISWEKRTRSIMWKSLICSFVLNTMDLNRDTGRKKGRKHPIKALSGWVCIWLQGRVHGSHVHIDQSNLGLRKVRFRESKGWRRENCQHTLVWWNGYLYQKLIARHLHFGSLFFKSCYIEIFAFSRFLK